MVAQIKEKRLFAKQQQEKNLTTPECSLASELGRRKDIFPILFYPRHLRTRDFTFSGEISSRRKDQKQ